MTLLYYDPVFQEHDTGDHPENGGRILAVVRHLNFVALDTSCKRPGWDAASVERLCYVHSRQYVDSVEQFAAGGGGYIEEDTSVSEKSYEVARMAVGAVCDAVERVVVGEDRTAFCLVRPPGHHAMPDHAMGFCLFNNIAVGARVATREFGLERVLIVDFDVHHGNGTQAMFWEDADVGAPWCGPCRMMAPAFAEAAVHLSPNIILAKLNIEASPVTASQFTITGIPTMILFNGGKEVSRQSGALTTHKFALNEVD